MNVMMDIEQVKIEIYIPKEFVEVLRDELTKIGACRIGNYDHVVAFMDSHGYWKSLEGSNPYDGEVNKLSYGDEYKMEIRCNFDLVENAIEVIKKIHPYEEPVINIVPLLNDYFNIR